jgi:hypothetical protein
MGGLWRRTGKWGRATRLGDRRVAPYSLSNRCNPENFTTHDTLVLSSTDMNDDIIDLYSIGRPKTTESPIAEEVPFVHDIHLIRPKRGRITVRALFDGGAMVSAMSTTAFNGVQNQLGNTTQSKRRLRMADGAVVPSQRRWEGPIELGKVEVIGEFEVFDSKGEWDFLLGKPLLRQFKAIHDYGADMVTVEHPNTGRKTVLHNQTHPTTTNATNEKSICFTSEVEQWENITGGTSGENPPSRQVLSTIHEIIQPLRDENIENIDQHCLAEDRVITEVTTPIPSAKSTIEERANTRSNNSGGEEQPPSREVIIDLETDRQTYNANDITVYEPDNRAQIHHVNIAGSDNYTRHTDPFKPERIVQILSEISIGTDTTPDERREVENLIAEFADCFALAMSEVNIVPGAVHKLNIPPGTKFRTRIGQRSMNPAQKEYLHTKVDEMVGAGIVAPIHPRDVRAVAPVVFSKKTHEGQGLPLDELKHRVNDQCVELGLPSAEDLPPRPMSRDGPNNETPMSQKWRLCQDFSEINRVTEIAPMPQGDIREKQQRLSGHRYVHVFDFAAGFYAISIDPNSQPYITFFVEGKGYFKYLRLPFGVTGGPSEFGQLTAESLCDIVGNNTIELFVDDGGASANTFEEGMTKLRTLLVRIRQEKLSLSASKLRVFMTEAVFAGATVGPDGVKPDTAKLTAIVNWPRPQDASHLEGFLGLSGYFRDLVKGYAKLEKPLRDILRAVETPKGIGKQAYQRIMRSYKLDSIWTKEHDKTFQEIKQRLVSEPVLKAPLFDGTPFIVTTDGSKDAFAGVLSQRITSTIPGGKKITRLHPLGYASKRTSTSEEKYKPYLLEFAALKFALDKFADIIWGFPVKLETDCQALRDVLLNDALHATHAHW